MKRQSDFKTQSSMAIPTARVRPVTPVEAKEPNMTAVALSVLFQAVSRKWIALASLIIGVVFGLVVLGWYVWPVEWTGGSYADLSPEDKGLLLQMATNLNVYNPNDPALTRLQQRWPELDGMACYLAANDEATEEQKIKLTYLAYQINNTGCNDYQHATGNR